MQAKVAEMGCVDISLDASPELASRASTTTSTMTVGSTHPREARQSTPGEVSRGALGRNCCLVSSLNLKASDEWIGLEHPIYI